MALSKIVENSIADEAVSSAKLKDFSAAVDLNGVENETVFVDVPEDISFPLNILSIISTVTVASDTTAVEARSLDVRTSLNLKYLAV